MSGVREVLECGPSFRLDEPVSDWKAELDQLEAIIGRPVDPHYKEFLGLGGLAELNFDQRVLSPSEILQVCGSVTDGFVPFASNGCGDFFAWRVADLPSSAVYFLDHQSHDDNFSAGSFLDCLSSWRRQ